MPACDTIKVLIVDDTVMYRKIVGDVLAVLPGVDVAGTANNGKIAISKITASPPDLIILDVEMPEVDGIGVLKHIQANKLPVKAVMLSSVTKEGSEKTIEALSLGAFDFIQKPECSNISESLKYVHTALSEVIQAFLKQREIKTSVIAPATASKAVVCNNSSVYTGRSDIVAIGISTGGPQALKEVLPKLPANLSAPVLLVQHMPTMFTSSLASSLNNASKINVCEAENEQLIEPGNVYIAPGGKQMKVGVNSTNRKVIKITDAPPENRCKPSADYLFRSVSQLYGANATCVVMTGMGMDGKVGMQLMKRAGAKTIAQNMETCVVYGMPKAVIDEGIVDIISPLNSIADEICKTVKA